jgi:hypothetical protein
VIIRNKDLKNMAVIGTYTVLGHIIEICTVLFENSAYAGGRVLL